jgi:hypothetical protein
VSDPPTLNTIAKDTALVAGIVKTGISLGSSLGIGSTIATTASVAPEAAAAGLTTAPIVAAPVVASGAAGETAAIAGSSVGDVAVAVALPAALAGLGYALGWWGPNSCPEDEVCSGPSVYQKGGPCDPHGGAYNPAACASGAADTGASILQPGFIGYVDPISGQVTESGY